MERVKYLITLSLVLAGKLVQIVEDRVTLSIDYLRSKQGGSKMVRLDISQSIHVRMTGGIANMKKLYIATGITTLVITALELFFALFGGIPGVIC